MFNVLFSNYLSLIICLFLILGFKKLISKFRLISILILSLFFLQAIILTYLQYLTFKEHPLSKYLLPPYQSLDYFLGFVIYHYFKDFYFRILGGFLNLILVIVLNLLFKQSLFYDDEYDLIFLSSILISFPLNILLIPVVLIIILLIHLKNFIFKKKFFYEKISPKNYWLFICFSLIIINIIIIKSEYLKQILFYFSP